MIAVVVRAMDQTGVPRAETSAQPSLSKIQFPPEITGAGKPLTSNIHTGEEIELVTPV